ncbi:unnamed protein product [Miscanthus lutarioriparius]|uniref:Uncharacterized protein n=1 Tax=Miscanthus lutarioriparius TaxID=422564 RepID=A0A811RSH8_9POAL|nr:unnamed protein product [Miscanthus lutarioriparius]
MTRLSSRAWGASTCLLPRMRLPAMVSPRRAPGRWSRCGPQPGPWGRAGRCGEAGCSHAPNRQRGYPRSLLRRVEEPPASPRTRAKTPLLQLVVVPRTPALQAVEDELSLALVALVLGTRPAVTPAAMLHYLHEHYGITEERVTVRRTRPDDFLVRFSRQADLELVLDNQRPEGAPFALCWRRWTRLIMGSAGPFRYRVLVGMKGISSHALSSEVAQNIIGSAGAKVEIANPEALADPDDERELFVACWCAHPDRVPDEIIMAVPEPEEEHDGEPPLSLRPDEIIHDEVPALRYLVRVRDVRVGNWGECSSSIHHRMLLHIEVPKHWRPIQRSWSSLTPTC